MGFELGGGESIFMAEVIGNEASYAESFLILFVVGRINLLLIRGAAGHVVATDLGRWYGATFLDVEDG